MNLEDLKRPFQTDQIHFRPGATTKAKDKAIALAYIDARHVYSRLDEVCGPENWQIRYPWSDGKRLCCEIGIFMDEPHQLFWIWKSNGAGDTDVEAEKGAFSDAAKRASVPWGIGEYLYHMPNNWYEIEPAGKSYKFTKNAKAAMKSDLEDFTRSFFGSLLKADLHKSLKSILKGLDTEDCMLIRETWDELNESEKNQVWKEFNTHQKSVIKQYLQDSLTGGQDE